MTNREKLAAYRLEIVSISEEDGGGYQALYPQLARTTVGYGETAAEALEDLNSGLGSLLESFEETGEVLPVPEHRSDWSEFSGRVTLRLAKSLHFRLDRLADAEGISLNSLLSDILQSGATALEAGFTFGVVGQQESVARQVVEELLSRRFVIDRMAIDQTITAQRHVPAG